MARDDGERLLAGNYLTDLLVTVILLCFLYLVTRALYPSGWQNGKYLTRPHYSASYSGKNTRINLPILIYHYVEDVRDPKDTIRKSLSIPPSVFEKQVLSLIEKGYTFLTPRDLPNFLSGDQLLPKNPVILSFDDGYEDFYTDVMPILKKHKVRAVSYIVSGFINKPNYMNLWQIKQIIESGLVEIGCHTASHPDLNSLAIDTVKTEIEACKKELFSKLGVTPVSFAYPYGSYNPQFFGLLETAGMKSAVTTNEGKTVTVGGMYEIPRLRPGVKTGRELTSFLENQIKTASINTQNP